MGLGMTTELYEDVEESVQHVESKQAPHVNGVDCD